VTLPKIRKQAPADFLVRRTIPRTSTDCPRWPPARRFLRPRGPRSALSISSARAGFRCSGAGGSRVGVGATQAGGLSRFTCRFWRGHLEREYVKRLTTRRGGPQSAGRRARKARSSNRRTFSLSMFVNAEARISRPGRIITDRLPPAGILDDVRRRERESRFGSNSVLRVRPEAVSLGLSPSRFGV
jgi:hypothetical protein